MIQILLVEDDDNLGFVVKDNLEINGYAVDWEHNGKAGWRAVGQKSYDVCILDVMMPEMDGFTLAEAIRAAGNEVPIIFLTAKSLKEDRIKGFKLGGDDYLTKPFSIEELTLRLEVILKRSGKKNGQTNHVQPIGKYLFDTKNLKLTCNDCDTELTQREAALLKLLLQHKNNVVPRDQILIELWGDDDYFKGRSLDVFITRLRKNLQLDPAIRLVNVHGVGFRLEC